MKKLEVIKQIVGLLLGASSQELVFDDIYFCFADDVHKQLNLNECKLLLSHPLTASNAKQAISVTKVKVSISVVHHFLTLPA